MELYGIYNLNGDEQKRSEILGIINKSESFGGVERFEIGLEQFDELVKLNFIDLSDNQNYSPTAEEFYEFIKKYPIVKAHGYAVSKSRADYRVSIEGLTADFNSNSGTDNSKLREDFIELCKDADEFIIDDTGLYSWWD